MFTVTLRNRRNSPSEPENRVNNTTAANLVPAIKDQLMLTKYQVLRLDKAFDLLRETAEVKKRDAMAGLIKEGDAFLEEAILGPVRDAGTVAASQKSRTKK